MSLDLANLSETLWVEALTWNIGTLSRADLDAHLGRIRTQSLRHYHSADWDHLGKAWAEAGYAEGFRALQAMFPRPEHQGADDLSLRQIFVNMALDAAWLVLISRDQTDLLPVFTGVPDWGLGVSHAGRVLADAALAQPVRVLAALREQASSTILKAAHDDLFDRSSEQAIPALAALYLDPAQRFEVLMNHMEDTAQRWQDPVVMATVAKSYLAPEAVLDHLNTRLAQVGGSTERAFLSLADAWLVHAPPALQHAWLEEAPEAFPRARAAMRERALQERPALPGRARRRS